MKIAGVAHPALLGNGVVRTLHTGALFRTGSSRLCRSGVGATALRPCTVSRPRPGARQSCRISAVAEVDAPSQKEGVSVSIDNAVDGAFTVVTIEGHNRPGLLSFLSAAFRDLGLDVGKVCNATSQDACMIASPVPGVSMHARPVMTAPMHACRQRWTAATAACWTSSTSLGYACILFHDVGSRQGACAQAHG